MMDRVVRLSTKGATMVMIAHRSLHAQSAQRAIRMLGGRVLSEVQGKAAALMS
jgi:hypothetical protein